MGRPTHVKPVRTGTSRSDFFKRSAGGAAMVVAATPLVPMGGLSAASADRSGTVGNTVFQHGVASGDPLQDRVILWTRVTPRVEATDTATATTQASAERDADEREDDDPAHVDPDLHPEDPPHGHAAGHQRALVRRATTIETARNTAPTRRSPRYPPRTGPSSRWPIAETRK